MKNEDKDPCVFLHHIQDEAAFIIDTISPMSRDEFFKSRLVQGSMRNSVMIIGEAVSNLPDSFKAEHPDVEWQKIKDTRNKYIHDYFSIDLMRVWIVLTQDIPPLKVQIDELIELMSKK